MQQAAFSLNCTLKINHAQLNFPPFHLFFCKIAVTSLLLCILPATLFQLLDKNVLQASFCRHYMAQCWSFDPERSWLFPCRWLAVNSQCESTSFFFFGQCFSGRHKRCILAGQKVHSNFNCTVSFRQTRSTYIYASESLTENGHGIHYLVFQEHKCFFHSLGSVDDNNND